MNPSHEKGATPIFRVVQRVPVVTYQERVILETDDWLEAEAKVSSFLRDNRNTMQRELPQVRGVHPSHEFATTGNPTCLNCGAWNNGSYGSHAPCGFDFEGRSLHSHIEEWRSPNRPGEEQP